MWRRVLGGLGTLVLGGFIAAPGAHAADRYALAGGCYDLQAGGRTVGEGGPWRMQATDLGRYLFYGRAGDHLTGREDGTTVRAAQPSEEADFRVDDAGGDDLRVSLPALDRDLGVRDGALVLVERGRGPAFRFVPAEGCATFPEIDVSASGTPARGATSYGEVEGFLDAHVHLMAYEFLGGRAHCGRPWHKFGVTFAMQDCPDHRTGGPGTVLDAAVSSPGGPHDPTGWPTFKDWPAPGSLTHEQTYYRGLERAWMGGLRLFVNLLVENAVLCNVYPLKQNSCDEMQSVRLQAARMFELQDYIDAQAGGPGKGFFRIVRTPFEARRVINDGKLAVVMGIENSRLFNCGTYNDRPTCGRADIDRQLDEVQRWGVASLELVNKFDNGLAGVAGDAGTFGVAVNSANRLETGEYWNMRRCSSGDEHAHDREQYGAAPADQDQLFGAVYQQFVPDGTAPVYGEGPHCNQKGLTELGAYLIRQMHERGLILDPDHMSVLARDQAMTLIESLDHKGVISSHSWSTVDSYPRIYRQGGVIAAIPSVNTQNFLKEYARARPLRDPRYVFGFGYGADSNGLANQPRPRGKDAEDPVTYPFKSLDGAVTLDRHRAGERVYDINVDGVAQYGLYADWMQELRILGGRQLYDDMGRGAEAYLQMWERARGVPGPGCRPHTMAIAARGMGALVLGRDPETLLRRAGQPQVRDDRVWRWCANARGKRAEDVVVMDARDRVALVASTAPGHRAKLVGAGARASKLRRTTRAFGSSSVRVRSAGRGRRFVYGVRGGRVRWVAVADRRVARTPATLRRALRSAGLPV